jgi:regulatory factor X
MVSQSSAASHSFNSNPEELIFRFGEQLSGSYPNATFDAAPPGDHHPSLLRANTTFKGQELRNQTHSVQDIPQEMHSHSLPHDAMNQYPLMYDTENQIPDQIMGEIEVPENNQRKRRGTTSTIANDNELRKLLRQYDGWGLKEMAEEVQRHEGTGGKSEKVKQVFAMVW